MFRFGIQNFSGQFRSADVAPQETTQKGLRELFRKVRVNFFRLSLALLRSLCNKRQLSRKNKFDKLSGMFPALVFVTF